MINPKKLERMRLVLSHYGPGAHPDGSPQSVHAGRNWRGIGGAKKVSVPARPAKLAAEDAKLYKEYLAAFPDLRDEGIKDVMARTQNTPEGVVYHASREGMFTDVMKPMNDIGPALYVGRDPHALGTFYGTLQGDEDTRVFAFKLDDGFRWLDMRDLVSKRQYKETAKLWAAEEGILDAPLGHLARALEYDGILYFDPWATGEEMAILNYDKVTQLGEAQGIKDVF
jgi:hypothetical protein